MKLKDVREGTPVIIAARVVAQKNGQTLLKVPGVGNTGQWSAVNTMDCLVPDTIVFQEDNQ